MDDRRLSLTKATSRPPSRVPPAPTVPPSDAPALTASCHPVRISRQARPHALPVGDSQTGQRRQGVGTRPWLKLPSDRSLGWLSGFSI